MVTNEMHSNFLQNFYQELFQPYVLIRYFITTLKKYYISFIPNAFSLSNMNKILYAIITYKDINARSIKKETFVALQ